MKFALKQLKLLSFRRSRPVLISDADEVIVHFANSLPEYLSSHGMYVNFTSYALEGNIKYRADDMPVDKALFGTILDNYFDQYVEKMPLVKGAAKHLESLSNCCDIIILSNIPHRFADRRRQSFREAGLEYPMISSSGPKGPLITALRQLTQGKLIFIDDISQHHKSVAKSVPNSFRIQYIADHHLDLIEQASPFCHVRCRDWCHIEQVILNYLDTRDR